MGHDWIDGVSHVCDSKLCRVAWGLFSVLWKQKRLSEVNRSEWESLGQKNVSATPADHLSAQSIWYPLQILDPFLSWQPSEAG